MTKDKLPSLGDLFNSFLGGISRAVKGSATDEKEPSPSADKHTEGVWLNLTIAISVPVGILAAAAKLVGTRVASLPHNAEELGPILIEAYNKWLEDDEDVLATLEEYKDAGSIRLELDTEGAVGMEAIAILAAFIHQAATK